MKGFRVCPVEWRVIEGSLLADKGYAQINFEKCDALGVRITRGRRLEGGWSHVKPDRGMGTVGGGGGPIGGHCTMNPQGRMKERGVRVDLGFWGDD